MQSQISALGLYRQSHIYDFNLYMQSSIYGLTIYMQSNIYDFLNASCIYDITVSIIYICKVTYLITVSSHNTQEMPSIIYAKLLS